jgi:plasmid stabilization system protein ParE
MTPVEFLPVADREALSALRRYVRKAGPVVAGRFQTAFDDAIARVGTNPRAWAKHLYGTRRCRLRLRYPYFLIYVVEPARVLVVAVAHDRRRPGYWRRRLP